MKYSGTIKMREEQQLVPLRLVNGEPDDVGNAVGFTLR